MWRWRCREGAGLQEMACGIVYAGLGTGSLSMSKYPTKRQKCGCDSRKEAGGHRDLGVCRQEI